MKDKKIQFSNSAAEEVKVMMKAVEDIMEQASVALRDNDQEAALRVEAMEEVIDHLQRKIKNRHIDRLKQGKCTIEQGFIMSDVITSLERISDHCSNIAGCVEEIAHDSLGLHAYTSEINKAPGSEFYKIYQENIQKYKLN